MPDGREQRHVEPAFGDQDLGGVGLDTGDRAQQLDHTLVRGEYRGDPLAEVLDRGVERVDAREKCCATMTPWCSIWKRLASASRSCGSFRRILDFASSASCSGSLRRPVAEDGRDGSGLDRVDGVGHALPGVALRSRAG